jgi:hypothetical protein
LRPHGSTGVSPQLRFAQAAGSLRHLDAGLELEPLFFTRIKRTVRKNGTVRIEAALYEVDLSLRALEVELRFDPYSMAFAHYRRAAQNRSEMQNPDIGDERERLFTA